MSILSIDFETRSAADLRKTGAARYFEDPSADVLCAAWAVEDGPVQTWARGQPCPDEIVHHVAAGGRVAAWNATFEFWAWRYVLGPKHGWPVPKIEQMVDTMAQAAAMSIPQSLDGAAQALALEQQKDKDGQRLIRKFSLPRKARKGETPGLLYWNEPEQHAEDFAAFVRYCAQDVEVERAIRKLLVPLSDYEQRVWELTLRMNDRGVHLDMALVDALQRIAEQAKSQLDSEMASTTGYAVSACSQVAALTRWLQAQGVDADKLNKNAIEDLLSNDLPEQARRAVELRKEAAKTSTAKLDAMQAVVCRDDRARGLHLYHGAGTGRWSGRLIQTQNMPRGTGTVKDPEAAVDDMMTGDARWIDLIYGQPMSAVSDMLRSCITASPGHRLLAADYSSIEGRVTAWLAGEQWKLDAFIANDEGRGPGMYELAAAGIFNLPVEKIGKKSSERQVGKAAELGLGFGGGVMAFDSMARVYGIDMSPVFPILRGTADPETWERAEKRFDECLERGDTGTDVMSREAWIASEVTKVQWRARHPSTVELWRGLEDAAREAVQNPGTIATYGRISYIVRRGFLWCRLPSGRCLAYGSPRIEDRKTPWGDTKPSVTALGVDSVTKRWTRFALYGGLLTENCVQAVARDLMAYGMLQVEDAGFPVVMTVHDEAVADVPEGHGTLAEFERLLCALPDWAAGLPVVASGWEGQRYRKD
jgi:DNA polymerase bacteriophage-type